MKFTCTGPHMLTKTLTDRHYGSREELCMAVAGVLRSQLERIPAEVIQLDEANITGHPEESEWAAAALNHVLDGVSGRKGVHLCFGNYGGQQIQAGIWNDLLPYLNALRCDFFLLEFARRGYEELHVLKDLKPSAGLGLSVVDIKDNEVEAADLIASRIEQAAKISGRGTHPLHQSRLRVLDALPQCCGPQDAGTGGRPGLVSGLVLSAVEATAAWTSLTRRSDSASTEGVGIGLRKLMPKTVK